MAELRSESESKKSEQRRVGLLYDERMCKHHTPNNEDHPENPNRIKSIWKKLQSAGIPQRYAIFIYLFNFILCYCIFVCVLPFCLASEKIDGKDGRSGFLSSCLAKEAPA